MTSLLPLSISASLTLRIILMVPYPAQHPGIPYTTHYPGIMYNLYHPSVLYLVQHPGVPSNIERPDSLCNIQHPGTTFRALAWFAIQGISCNSLQSPTAQQPGDSCTYNIYIAYRYVLQSWHVSNHANTLYPFSSS